MQPPRLVGATPAPLRAHWRPCKPHEALNSMKHLCLPVLDSD